MFDNNEGFIVNGNNKLIPMISSAIIPGSGQYFINGDKKKGMLFFGLELDAWAGYFFYKNNVMKVNFSLKNNIFFILYSIFLLIMNTALIYIRLKGWQIISYFIVI